MKSYQILTVNLTKEGKKTNKPYFVITTNGGVIVRRVKQFLNDIENLLPSGLTAADVEPTDMAVRRIMRDLTGGMAIGDVRFFKKGDSYPANEFSPEVVAGTAVVGQKLIHKADGAWVEGFLTLQVSDKADLNGRIAEAHADALMRLRGAIASAPKSAAREVITDDDGSEDIGSATNQPIAQPSEKDDMIAAFIAGGMTPEDAEAAYEEEMKGAVEAGTEEPTTEAPKASSKKK